MNEHVPVLLSEVLTSLVHLEKGGLFVDGTFGRGGHTRALLEAYPQSRAVVGDRDPAAVAAAQSQFASEITSGRLLVYQDTFLDLVSRIREPVDAILLDLGVSSPQLDNPERGFSFHQDGPLDMRMNPDDELDAAHILNHWSESELVDLFRDMGEISRPHRVVRAICHDRKSSPWSRTSDFAAMIARVDGWRRKGFHPATQYFMALRMMVNAELDQVQRAVAEWITHLRPGGRIAVITFHSLEDRIVKTVFRQSSLGRPVNKKVIVPSDQEIERNPRSRSAKLRVFERT